MPTYVYACADCGERLEVVQRITDDALTVCPNCSGSLRKVIQPVGIVFKGSGFYKTDSRGKSSSSPGDKSTDKPSTDAKGAASTTESSGAGGSSSEGSSSDASSTKPASGDSKGSTSTSNSSGSTPASKSPAKTSGS